MKWLTTYFRFTRRPKLSSKEWIRSNEIHPFIQKIIWITQEEMVEGMFKLGVKIKRLVKRSGWGFTFLYLKECQRLIIKFLAGSPQVISPGVGILVMRDSYGLPSIIPLELRSKIILKDGRWIKLILSLISIYRVFPTKVLPTLRTITQPWMGVSNSILRSEEAVLELFGKKKLRISKPRLIQMESSGPNAFKSAFNSGWDALSFISYPYQLLHWSRLGFKLGGHPFVFWVWLIVILLGPYYILLRLAGGIRALRLGKLSIVYDQAGKARVIAITNYFHQLIMKPIHNSLFEILKKLETDGTFDQEGPLLRLVEADSDEWFYSFDLSAATDRLPLETQKHILNILSPGLGSLWAKALDIPWFYKDEYYKYAVGQPMGAYSSWAMLAVTHHVIVKSCALRCGIKGFNSYAILGDDIVIRNKSVADEYLRIMRDLGLEINLDKSVISPDFAEFAKRWIGKDIDYTPIGPGLVLQAVRRKWYIPTLVREALKLNFITNLPQLLIIVKGSPNPILTLWSAFGIESLKWVNRYDPFGIYQRIYPVKKIPFINALCSTLRVELIREIDERILKFQTESEFFFKNWLRITLIRKEWSIRILEILLRVLGPTYWIYHASLTKEHEECYSPPSFIYKMIADESLLKDMLEESPSLTGISIQWNQKKEVRDHGKKVVRFRNGFEKNLTAFNYNSSLRYPSTHQSRYGSRVL